MLRLAPRRLFSAKTYKIPFNQLHKYTSFSFANDCHESFLIFHVRNFAFHFHFTFSFSNFFQGAQVEFGLDSSSSQRFFLFSFFTSWWIVFAAKIIGQSYLPRTL